MDEQRYVSGYAERIQNVFSDLNFSEVERIDGDKLWACLSFIVMKVFRKMELCIERNG